MSTRTKPHKNGQTPTGNAQSASVGAHSADAEQYVVGCLLREPELSPQVQQTIEPADFYLPRERIIAREIFELSNKGATIDSLIVAEALQQSGVLQEAGGPDYLIELMGVPHHTGHVVTHSKTIAEKSRRRKISARLYDALHLAGDPSISTDDLADYTDGITAYVGENARNERLTLDELVKQYPDLAEPIVDGIGRRGEYGTIVGLSKAGKSFLLWGLVFSITFGWRWLGRFATKPGKCLVIDNELPPAVIKHRIIAICGALQIDYQQAKGKIEIESLRGKRQDIFQIERRLQREHGFDFIGIDALYRAYPKGMNENDNAKMTEVYDAIASIANSTNAMVGVSHHSPRGNVGDRRVVDLGAGGGAQGRAADFVIGLREHELPDHAVLEGVVRSFAPPEPLGITWAYPLWTAEPTLDLSKVKGKQPAAQAERDSETDAELLELCMEWRSRSEIKRETGWGDMKLNRAIARCLKCKTLARDKQDRPRNPGTEVFQRMIHGF